jgi:hypothetical protein
MWLLVNRPGTKLGAFVSIVAKNRKGGPSGKTPDSILSVRARRSEDLDALFPGCKVHDGLGSGDYQFRCFQTREAVAKMLASRAMDLSATNFKSSISADPKLAHAAHEIWDSLAALQPIPPYGRHVRAG